MKKTGFIIHMKWLDLLIKYVSLLLHTICDPISQDFFGGSVSSSWYSEDGGLRRGLDLFPRLRGCGFFFFSREEAVTSSNSAIAWNNYGDWWVLALHALGRGWNGFLESAFRWSIGGDRFQKNVMTFILRCHELWYHPYWGWAVWKQVWTVSR